jgi:hypothetical protein
MSLWSLNEENLQNSPRISALLVILVQTVNLVVKVYKKIDLAFFLSHVSMMSRH